MIPFKSPTGVDSLAEGLVVLAESTTTGLAAVDDPLIKADCCKMKEATNAITRADAPHSAIAKLRRDMDFNIMNPLRCHVINNRNMKSYLDKRRRRLLEYNIAKREMDDCVKKNLHQTDRKYLAAQSQLESAKLAFHEVDKHIFEWLLGCAKASSDWGQALSKFLLVGWLCWLSGLVGWMVVHVSVMGRDVK